MVNTNKPAFNFTFVHDSTSLPRNGTQVMLMYLEDIKEREGSMMFLQMCDAGYRMGHENEDYKHWNQCIFEDIDYKDYIELHKDSYIEPLAIYERLWNWLYNNYKDIIYYGELSKSKKGFHFIFFFNVQRTKNNRLMCKSLTNFIIHKAFEECGYKDIIEANGVYDNCTNSFYQPCFLTKNNYKMNNECTGKGSDKIILENYYSIKNIYEKLDKKKYVKKESNNQNKDKWLIEYEESEDIIYKGKYLNHHERWNLFDYLSGLCGNDEDKLYEEWVNCARQLPEGNGHDTNFYINEPYKNHWDKKRDSNNYIDAELLKQFGYNIKFINKNYEDKTNKKTNKIRKERIYLP